MIITIYIEFAFTLTGYCVF